MKKFNLKLAATVMVCGAFLFSSCIGLSDCIASC